MSSVLAVARIRGYNTSTIETVHVKDADGIKSTRRRCRLRREWVARIRAREGKIFASVSLIFGYWSRGYFPVREPAGGKETKGGKAFWTGLL